MGFGISEVLMFYTLIPAFVVYPVLVFFVTNPRKGVMRLQEETKRSKTKLLAVQAVWLFLACAYLLQVPTAQNTNSLLEGKARQKQTTR